MNSLISAILGELRADAAKTARVLPVVVGMLLLALPLCAQMTNGRIFGRVTDPSGAVVPGATVIVTNVATGVARDLVTDHLGQYNAPALIPGTYTVRVSATGFKTVSRQNIKLEVGQDIEIDVRVTPGLVSQTVTVTAAPPLVNTTNATLGGTLSTKTINNLPLNGRNYIYLVSLRPGANQYPGGGGWTQSSNGLRVDAQSWLIEGVDNNEPYLGFPDIGGQSPAGDEATIVPIDAISQFNVMENPKAEYGWASGAVVNVGIKSGTNHVHGTAYAFGRAGAMDARNFFNNGPQNPLGVEQWGGTVGGPIRKNKLFYFGGFEQQRYNLGVPQPLTIPTNLPGSPTVSIPAATAALNSYCASGPTPTPPFCSAGAFVPNALSQKLLPLFGTSPNANGSLVTNFTASNLSNSVLGKVDYNINSHNTLSAFYFFGNDNNTSEDFPATQQEFLTLFHERAQSFIVHWNWIPNARWVNQASFGYTRFVLPIEPFDHGVPPTSFGINTGVTNPIYGGMPAIHVGGLVGDVGGTPFWPHFNGPDNTFDFVDNVSYLHGNHAFKWGVEVRVFRITNNPASEGRGEFYFNGSQAFSSPTSSSTGLEDFLAGTPTRAVLSVGNSERHLHENSYAIFGQDEWRATPRLTLNLGLRWEYSAPFTDTNNLLASWNPTQGLFQAGGSQGSSVYNTSTKDFAPRFGLAWDIFGNGKTVLRGGGGVYYDTLWGVSFIGNSLNLQNGHTSGINANPTGAYFVNPASGAAVKGSGNIATASFSFSPSLLNWNTSGGPVFKTLSAPLACGDGATTVTSGPAALIGTTPAPCPIFAVAKNLQTPYVADWTLGIEQAITNRLSLDVAYVGNHGSNLTSVVDVNQINPALPAEISCGHCEANTSRPYGTKYPDLSFINLMGNDYRSNYDGLQATLTARNFHRMTFVLGYTYSHALDQMAFSHYPFTPQNSLNPGAGYASSDIDLRDRLTLAWTYDIPGVRSPGQLLQGWVINTIIVAQSAMPWQSFDTASDISGTGELMDRWDFFGKPTTFSGHSYTSIPYCSGPDFTNASTISCTQTTPAGSVNLSSQQTGADASACLAAAGMVPNGPGGSTGVQSLDQYGCFSEGSSVMVPPAIGSFGISGRNIFRDSGFLNADFSVFKDFHYKERLTAEFRAEFFNVFNHPNFANPFGSITAWGPGFTSDPSNPATFGCGCQTPDVAQTDPVLGPGGARDIQLGLKLIF